MALSLRNLTYVPWFMLTYPPGRSFSLAEKIGGFNLITSRTVPDAITKTRKINRASIQIPGGRATLHGFGSIEATQISFSIKFGNFTNALGVTPYVQFFEHLRNQAEKAFGSVRTDVVSFTPTPKVLYMYGTGSVPLIYDVQDVGITTKNFNKYGYPQVCEASVVLVEDVSSDLNKLERVTRDFLSKLVAVKSLRQSFGDQSKNIHKNPKYT